MENVKLEKNYNPSEIEDKIYEKWLNNKCFSAKPNKNKKPFTIVMPPPNVTGKLHMGHALDIAIQDAIIRYKRLNGFETLWQPGTDHAAISTEVKVVNKLKESGIDKRDIGREGFLKEAWKWKEEYESSIILQQRKLGASCDWDKMRFTMDEGCSKAVLHTFKKLYDKGLIYKGNKIINWCPKCKTTISDAEVEYEEKEGALYHIKYFFADDKEKFIVIATTRPETLFGDTAVAVNPTDERYKDIVGKKVILPLVNKEIEIIADEYVDKEFGTGLVKITPCHDPNDFEVGLRHNLDQIQILDDEARIMLKGTKYDGLPCLEAREIVINDLKESGNLLKIEKYSHNVGTHDRCKCIVEPMVKSQWFVKMEPLAKPAIKVLEDGILKFIPVSFSNIYLHWLNNIKDWCISRQIWWGHRIPVYYCKDCGHMTVSENSVYECEKCHSKNVYQDEDTLDTWFSSALWPFSTLGFPNETEEYKYFYPTNVLVTGYDIIFFWVIRMVFSGIEQTSKCPFNEVLIHGIVRDDKGRKMSKSLGNGIDPLVITEKYGADALRMALLTGNAPGNDFRFYESRVESSRNFLNKIWNATRFILMYDISISSVELNDLKDISDLWIITILNKLIKEVIRNMDNYDLGIALDKIERFIRDEFCDWYIEFVKPRLYGDNIETKKEAIFTLRYVLNNCLKLLHPFCPFITEEIYDKLNPNELLITSNYPKENNFNYFMEEKAVEYIKEVIRNIRNRRKELNVPNSKTTSCYVLTNDDKIKNIFNLCESYLIKLAFISSIKISDNINDLINKNEIDKFIQLTFDKSHIFIPLDELVDKEKELEKLNIDIEKIKKEIERSKGMLNNPKFIDKAPKEKVDEEKMKLDKYENLFVELNNRLKSLG